MNGGRADLAGAVIDGDLVAAAAALRAGSDPNRRDALGYPPLHLAAARGQVQMAELLLTAGADPLLPDTRMGACALHKAAIGGVVEVARVLLDHGAFINQQAPIDGQTPLWLEDGLLDSVKSRGPTYRPTP